MKKKPSCICRALCSQTFKIICAGFIVLSFASEGYPEVQKERDEAVIARIIEAYGGRTNLSGVFALSAEGRIQKHFPDDSGSYVRHMQRDRKLFVEIRYTNATERRVLNGKRGYRSMNGKLEAVKGPPYDAMVYQYNQIDLPFGFLDGSFRVVSVHRDSLSGEDVNVVRLQDTEGYELDISVRAADSLILRAVGYFKVGSSRTNLGAEFSDFRKVEGILLPFKIINYARGSKLGETTITQYRINPRIDNSVFQP